MREVISSLISSFFSQLPAALFHKPAELQTAGGGGGEERIVLVWRSVDRAKEDVRVEEASSTDRRETRRGGDIEETTVAERVEGESFQTPLQLPQIISAPLVMGLH